MDFSGDVSGAMSFTLTGAPVLGAETKSLDLSASYSVTHGTGDGQATAGWSDLVSVPANSVYSVDLGNADASALGFNGSVQFTEVRALWVRNRAAEQTAVVLIGCPSAGNDTTAYAAKLPGGARWCWDDFTTGIAVTSANRQFTITNTSAAAVQVEICVIGLGTYVDT